jgi:hypothetical protein
MFSLTFSAVIWFIYGWGEQVFLLTDELKYCRLQFFTLTFFANLILISYVNVFK